MSSLNVISGSDCLRGWRRSNLMLFPIYSPRSMGYWKKKIDSCIYCQQQIKRGVGSTHIQLRIMLCWLHFSPFFFLPFLFLLPRSEKKRAMGLIPFVMWTLSRTPSSCYERIMDLHRRTLSPYSLKDWALLEQKQMFKPNSSYVTFNDFFQSYLQNIINPQKINKQSY